MAILSCRLNCWEWPLFLPFKPKNWNMISTRAQYRNKIFGFYVWLVRNLTTKKERSMAWHTVKLSRTKEEFDLWWEKNSKSVLALDKLIYS
jgi:hypothetical protein